MSKNKRRKEKMMRKFGAVEKTTGDAPLVEVFTMDGGGAESKEVPVPQAAKIRELKWHLISDFKLVPRYLVEQIKDRPYSVEMFYSREEKDPTQQIWVLLSPENVIKGFVWLTVVLMTHGIFVNSYSVDKEYCGDGGPVNYCKELLLEIYGKLNLSGGIKFSTTYPDHYEAYGIERSKYVVMEIPTE